MWTVSGPHLRRKLQPWNLPPPDRCTCSRCLQSRPTWTAEELAERLGVTTRTVRRDVTRLRDLGYPVMAAPGPFGGYQLGSGGVLPPILLSDDEAVAVAIGLRAAAQGGVSGIEDAAVSALAKLEQMLPAVVRERLRALYGRHGPDGRGVRACRWRRTRSSPSPRAAAGPSG